MSKILQSGVDVRQSFCQGSGTYTLSLLECAAGHGHSAITYELLRAGADTNAKVNRYRGRTALEAAAERGQLDIAHLLMVNNPNLQKLKLECKRAARHARRWHQNFIARLLEQKAKALTEELGEHEIDRQVGSLCDCQILRIYFEDRCTSCVNRYPVEQKWLASLMYLTNMAPGLGILGGVGFGLSRELTGSETQDEIESLLFER